MLLEGVGLPLQNRAHSPTHRLRIAYQIINNYFIDLSRFLLVAYYLINQNYLENIIIYNDYLGLQKLF